MALILALPLSAIVVLAGLSVVSAASGAQRAELARRLVHLGGVAGELTAALQHERTAAALVFAAGSSASALDEYRHRADATETMVRRFRDIRARLLPPAGQATLLRRVDGQLADLDLLRQQVRVAADAATSVVIFRYRAVIADLIAYRQGLSQVGVAATTANDLRASAALSQAVEWLALMQVAVVRTLDSGRLTPAAHQEIVGANAGFVEGMQAFQSLAPGSWRVALNAQVRGREVLDAERLQSLVARAQPGAVLQLGTDAIGWTTAVGARVELMHGVERTADGEVLAAVTRERDDARRTSFTVAATVCAGLLLMVLIGWWVTRSLTRSLARLRRGAEAVATHRLPRMVRRLEGATADPATVERLVAEAAEPIVVDGSDEVGQVAAAFNAVSARAVRIAGEQAALRGAISGIFVSVSRRLQRRADRMMVSIDGLERDEQDPDRLRNLFDLDHVATLIRRLIANLQVLAGGRAGRPTPEPVSLPDLLRAAGQEIDDYTRVELAGVDPGVEVTADAAEELIHLLAELLDNAAKYSPPESPVTVEGRKVGDLLHVQVRDSGIGMRQEDLQAVRERVADPRRIDQRTTEQMGMPVVGAIAGRLGIKVEFRSEWRRGTRVDLTIPADLFTVAPVAAPAAGDSFTDAATPSESSTAELPPWPPMVVAPVSPVRGATSEVGPMIFEQLRRDPSRSWFAVLPGDTGADGDAGRPLSVGVGWQEAAAAAEAVRSAVPAETTTNGLPVRQPGQRVIPVPDLSAQPRVPTKRRPDELRRQMSAFQSGLGAAGRRTVRTLVEEPQR